jgi:hypothetical protein
MAWPGLVLRAYEPHSTNDVVKIENSWQIGCGPNGLPYSSFEEEGLWFDF